MFLKTLILLCIDAVNYFRYLFSCFCSLFYGQVIFHMFCCKVRQSMLRNNALETCLCGEVSKCLISQTFYSLFLEGISFKELHEEQIPKEK